MNWSGPIKDIRDGALDTESHHIDADGSLTPFDELDRAMDEYQEAGYVLVRAIARHSSDPRARAAAIKALQHFEAAERVEGSIEDQVAAGHGAVRRARRANQRVINLADAGRSLKLAERVS